MVREARERAAERLLVVRPALQVTERNCPPSAVLIRIVQAVVIQIEPGVVLLRSSHARRSTVADRRSHGHLRLRAALHRTIDDEAGQARAGPRGDIALGLGEAEDVDADPLVRALVLDDGLLPESEEGEEEDGGDGVERPCAPERVEVGLAVESEGVLVYALEVGVHVLPVDPWAHGVLGVLAENVAVDDEIAEELGDGKAHEADVARTTEARGVEKITELSTALDEPPKGQTYEVQALVLDPLLR